MNETRECFARTNQKKKHTKKTQIVVDQNTGLIILFTAYYEDYEHDLYLLNNSQLLS